MRWSGAETAPRTGAAGRYEALMTDDQESFCVATRAYTDASVFVEEMRGIFERTFVYVGHESELQHEGDYKTARIARCPVIVCRDQSGTVRVFVNACRHRGNAICREPAGTTRHFRCPYHGWLYALDGRLLGAPDRESFPESVLRRAGGLIPAAAVAVYRGLIFARLRGQGSSDDFSEFLEPIRQYVDIWADRSIGGEYVLRQPHRYSYPGNWKLQMDNSLDGYHGPYVHESGFAALAYRRGDGPPTSPQRARRSRSGDEQFLGFAKSAGAFSAGFPRGHGLTHVPHDLGSGLVGITRLSDDVYEEYVSALLSRYGKERTKELVAGRHLLIFPNLILMDCNIRVVHPISVDFSYVESYFIEMSGVDAAVNAQRLRDLQARLGTAGFIGTDDVEMFSGNQTGLAGLEEIYFSKGIQREVESDGSRRGSPSDEVPQRAFYREWSRLMGTAADESS